MNGAHSPACETYEAHVDRLIAEGHADRLWPIPLMSLQDWAEFQDQTREAELDAPADVALAQLAEVVA